MGKAQADPRGHYQDPSEYVVEVQGRHRLHKLPQTPGLGQIMDKKVVSSRIGRVSFIEEENDYSNIPELVKYAQGEGAQIQVSLLYSLSPVHTDEYYAKKVREAVATGAEVIEIKDQSGLLTPDRTKTLVPAVSDSINGDAELQFQTHCNTGLGLLCTLEAIKLGIKTIRSCLPSG